MSFNLFHRDSSAHMTYKLISESTFSKRHSLVVKWSQEQGPATSGLIPSLLYESDTHSFKVEMISVACPDATQSEAYVSTIALFSLFASTPEQKVYMRLPSVWRDMWEELSHLAKEQQDTSDRDVLRELRSMIEETGRAKDGSSTNGSIPKFSAIPKKTDVESDISKAPQPSPAPSSDELKDLWIAKERTSSYQQMLSARMNLPVYNFKEELLLAITERQVVIICGETGCGKSTQG